MLGAYATFTIRDLWTLLRSAGTTLWITLISITIGTVIGTGLGMVLTSRNRFFNKLPHICIQPLRNSPLITQIFLVYFGIPSISKFTPSATVCAIVALSLNTSAFFAVILNTSVRAIPQAQWEAGLALGHSKAQTFVRIVAPQAIRLLIPQAILLYIGQLQCSSFIALISIRELTRTGETIAMRTSQPFLVWGIVFAIYFLISFPISKFARALEKKVSFKN